MPVTTYTYQKGDSMATDTIENMVLSNIYADLIVPVQSDTEDFLKNYRQYGAQLFGGRLGMIHVPRETDSLNQRISYSSIPKLYTTLDYESLTSSGILRVQTQPSLSYRGKGVLLGFLDTGIDYTSPAFLTPEGQTRILGLWDQTETSGTPPYDLGYGTAYTSDEINRALQTDRPFDLIPSVDTSGHGTFLTGVAAGSPDSSRQFLGAAPEADLAIVKLKEAKPYLQDYFLTNTDQPVFQETDIMMGIRYLVILSILYEKPLVICLGLGTSQGDHSGNSALDRLLTYYVDYQNCFCTCAGGNETGAGHHFSSIEPFSSESTIAEIAVPSAHPGFCMEIWAASPALYTLTVISPLGESISEITPKQGTQMTYHFIAERSVLEVRYEIAEFNSGFQLIFLRLLNPTEGIWSLRLRNSSQIQTNVHMWLPIRGLQQNDVFFLAPDPDTTVTGPGNTPSLITLGGYDAKTESIWASSSRGYALSGQVKPDLTAPAVEVYGPSPSRLSTSGLPSLDSFTRKTGTSAASALAAGALAILINWSMERSNDFFPFLTNRSAKNYLIRGARRRNVYSYPNREWGYGELDLYGVFESLL